MILGYFFLQTTSYVEENEKKISHMYGKRENANFHVEAASGSRKT